MTLIIVMGGLVSSFLYALTQSDSISFLTRRSRCDTCSKHLKVTDLIPVISYIKNRGRCSYCRAAISVNYLMVEILTIILFILPLIVPPSYDNMLLYYLLVSILIPLSVYDFDTLLIPTHMLILLFVCGLFLTGLEFMDTGVDLMSVIILHIFYILFKDKIGYGDIQLFSILTMITPFDFFIFTFLFTYIIGGISVIILDLFETPRITKVPLVPFIAASLFTTFYLYADFIDIYYGGF
ncbi:peptidase [Jeotgalicoccus coquinae]|uniref:Leader peptidase (Prepilin peptidase)/N-methyltransferase n=1 Tax=Jeotgalicoccus coquinae TaxID=709509 RepID=A0A6V7RBX6_9STAP|nr:A24 family peptidase [Jeotgalicoccus coquinae]MBB6422748.1 leader peptidase (prepilin peptidase)/N-methyltransferase [Jeotgalicoccus coquinae]GGE13447.1 peptidase [Jeotgalicoccus coquinae]CAD2074375.1 Type 4 prepilin-like proteins leader peptide-processing enzyme [Jeotgalicoccus coquinae]